MNGNHVGWIREGQSKWLVVCSADDERECWRLLLAFESRAKFTERLVNDGRHPEESRRKRRTQVDQPELFGSSV